MPYSSGGGSSFGGTFGGSSNSRINVRRINVGRASDGKLYKRSSSFFPGSTKYRYYYRGQWMYYYANMAPSSYTYASFLMIFLSILVFASALIGREMWRSGRFKLSMNYNTNLVVEDNIHRVKNESELLNTFSIFQKKTGITPAFITISYNDFETNYDDIEKYAYHEYIRRFSDEKHWLIVYAQKGSAWQFIGMQGNDTSYILNEDVTSEFNLFFNRKLTEGYSPDQAYTAALNDIIPDLKSNISGKMIFKFIVFVAIGCFIVILLDNTPKQNAMRNAEEVLPEPEKIRPVNNKIKMYAEEGQDTCDLCFNSYPKGLYSACPNCGSPFPREAPKEEEPEKIEFYQGN